MTGIFSHLSTNELESLISRYYNKEKVADLIKEYKLDVLQSNLVKHFPRETSEIICKYCKINLSRNRNSRDYSWNRSEFICPQCQHSENQSCNCKNCREIEKARLDKEKEEKQEIVNQILNSNTTQKVKFEELDFYKKIYLGALLREGISEDYNFIKPIELFINPIAPTYEFQSEITNELINNDLIVINPNTDPNSINIVDFDKGYFRYNPLKVIWSLNIESDNVNKVQLVEHFILPSDLQAEDYENAFLLWKKIALFECIDYFKVSIRNILRLDDYAIGEKTASVFTTLLNDFSVSQIYGIIYKSVNEALRYQAESNINKKHAANSIIGKALSYGERAKLNKWDISKYSRIKDCPESALSKFFFEKVLKIGYNGFNVKPYKFNSYKESIDSDVPLENLGT